MHEVSLCRQLAAAVTRAAGHRTVETVHVDVGRLRQVVPEAMQFAWTFVVRGTPLAAADLQLRVLPVVLTCTACDASTELGPELGFDCRACGASATTVSSGEQFLLAAIEVRTETKTETKGEDDGPLPSA